MTIRGIGKNLEFILVPYIIIAIVLSYIFYPFFIFASLNYPALFIIGIILLIAGLTLHIIAASQMIHGFTNKRLVTNGLYSISRNPMYTTIIFLIIPGLSLLINSWLVITTSIVMFVFFLLFIKKEDQYLLEQFGEEYINYKKRVGLFLPNIFKSK